MEKKEKKEGISPRAERVLEPITSALGMEIYDVEYVREAGVWYLRAYIDKPGGVDILDCEKVSRAFSDALDAEDFVPEAYVLEVSSPGLGRALRKDRHLAKSLGAQVELKLFAAVDGSKQWEGVLESYDARDVVVSGRRFQRDKIAKINLAWDF